MKTVLISEVIPIFTPLPLTHTFLKKNLKLLFFNSRILIMNLLFQFPETLHYIAHL